MLLGTSIILKLVKFYAHVASYRRGLKNHHCCNSSGKKMSSTASSKCYQTTATTTGSQNSDIAVTFCHQSYHFRCPFSSQSPAYTVRRVEKNAFAVGISMLSVTFWHIYFRFCRPSVLPRLRSVARDGRLSVDFEVIVFDITMADSPTFAVRKATRRFPR